MKLSYIHSVPSIKLLNEEVYYRQLERQAYSAILAASDPNQAKYLLDIGRRKGCNNAWWDKMRQCWTNIDDRTWLNKKNDVLITVDKDWRNMQVGPFKVKGSPPEFGSWKGMAWDIGAAIGDKWLSGISKGIPQTTRSQEHVETAANIQYKAALSLMTILANLVRTNARMPKPQQQPQQQQQTTP